MEFDLEYNSERPHLIIPEYGRHVQKLIDNCVAIEDPEERNKMARAIVDVMGNLQPHLRDVPDFKHKLWDQLFIMSDFKLDAESPYGKPLREELAAKPESLAYPKYDSKYRFYGNNIQTMIDVALTWEEGEAREALYFAIANHMKKCYLNWNKDTVDDAIIYKHLLELSKGRIDLEDKNESLTEVKELMKKRKPTGKVKILKKKQ
ncbi:MAG: methionyl-tRNA formyltransferase [Flavobacteria bacterium RIFCSPLOWO2_12_FULL_35_11]|nr:MAG: methionyl-tRNA formyltransferase [Flavobacteria bacterium RIFCSPLOWO2_12_FULL_35_11]